MDEIRAAALLIYREQSAIREGVTAEDVKSRLLGMACCQQVLLNYFRAFNENFDKQVGVKREPGSAKCYWYAFNCVTRFLREKYHLTDIPFSALDNFRLRLFYCL